MESDAIEKLRTVLRTKNEREMIQIILNTTREERTLMSKKYEEKYGTPLIKEISRRFSGDFMDATQKLFMSRPEFMARELQKAFKAFTLDNDSICEIIAGLPSPILKEVNDIYSTLDKNTLEHTISKKAEKSLRQILLAILQTTRSENNEPDLNECKRKVQLLMGTKPEKWLTNEDIVRDVFASSSSEELLQICRIYHQKTGVALKKAYEKASKMHSYFLTMLLYNLISPSEYYATKLNESIKGLGTDTNLLERIIIGRYDVDIALIKKYYYAMYETTAKQDIADDTSGNYRELMVKLLYVNDRKDY